MQVVHPLVQLVCNASRSCAVAYEFLFRQAMIAQKSFTVNRGVVIYVI